VTTLAADLYLLVAAYGLALPVSYAGLPVLGQGAFVAVGAFGTFQLAAHGTPLLVAVAAAVAMAAVAGYLVGYAAARLAGASLALATWGLAWLGYVALVQFPDLSGGSAGLTRPTPARLESPALGLVVTTPPWVHVLVAGILAGLVATALFRARTGPWALDWAALRTGPDLATSLGVPVQRRRRALLAAAAALGALGGAGGAVLQGVIAPPDFSPLLSLQLFVAVLVGGTATWWGPVAGVALLAALPETADRVADVLGIDPLRARAVLTAALLVAALAARQPVARWFAALRRGDAAAAAADEPEAALTGPSAACDGPLVTMRDVVVDYGAVRALDGVDLELRGGEVHALIGPNGSGKSTALRVLAGALRADAGTVVAAPGDVAVTRTLQRTATLGDLAAGVQVAVGARARERTPFLGLRHLLATPGSQVAEARRRAVRTGALAAVGLTDRAAVPASRLDSAEQRLLQVGRAVATGAPALLLDEPAAGMSRPDRAGLVGVLRGLAAAGHGVLLVEHDMGVVGRAADRVTVLAAGRVLATGTPAEVRGDPAVRAAYLGDTDTVVRRRTRREPRPQ
jgi:ABC-type branched-subunit amino acid transport system ATPase component/ABC-type branched-subunit amino acid transport system permease subunit